MTAALALLASPLVRYVGVAVLIFGALAWIRHDAASDARDEMRLEIQRAVEAERQRIAQANREALSKANEEAAKLADENDALERRLELLQVEAAADARAADLCLGADAVKRLRR